MEIAASGFVSSLGSAATADATRQRQSPANDRASQASGEQAAREQRNQTRTQSQTTTAVREADSARVINGEVLSSETARVRTDQSASNLLGRSPNNQQAPNDQPDTRRISVQQALQNFSQNDALASDSNNPRQVSGIIDEFV